MKKAVMIIIGIVYLASIVIISIFGMRSVVFNEIIPVSKIECINVTDDKINVSEENNIKIIKIKYDKPANTETNEGTMVQLEWRVLPDNATTKDVKFVYDPSPRATFATDEAGREVGLILFTGKVVLPVKIMSTDGSRVYAELTIWAY